MALTLIIIQALGEYRGDAKQAPIEFGPQPNRIVGTVI